MADPDRPRERWPPVEFYTRSVASIITFVIAAALAVSAVVLYTYCEPITINGNSVCLFSHWLAATFFAVGAGIFAIVGLYLGVTALFWLDAGRDR